MSTGYVAKEFEPIKGLQIRALTDPRICERIKVLDSYCFPVKYSADYYDNYVRPVPHVYNQVAFFHDMLVGSITCRFEKTDVEDRFKLYIMTIGVLEPYRHMGIGARLLQTVLTHVHQETHVHIAAVTLHMQVGSPVIEFYKRFNFEVKETVKDYYTDISPPDADYLVLVVPQPHLHDGKKGKSH